MKFRIIFLLLLAAAFVYCSCSDGKKNGNFILPKPPSTWVSSCPYDDPVNVGADLISLADANNEFGLDVYEQIKTEDGNLFFSPTSIFTALSMTYAGAQNQTAAEMRNVLHFPLPDDELHLAIGKLVSVLESARKNSTLSVANSLWGQQGYGFLNEFLNLLATAYQAPMHEVDYAADPEAARLAINQWVEDNTNDLIKELLRPGMVDSLTRLYLVNAIYFKSTWMHVFPETGTCPQDFDVSTGRTVQADMMHMSDAILKGEAAFNYYNGSTFKALELPYADGIFSMLIFLPDDIDGIAALEDNFTFTNYAAWINGMQYTKLDALEMPLLKYTNEFSLKAVLETLGMPTAFEPGSADFSGINGGAEQLYITNVAHKAFVKVNEEGAEAAAATGVGVGGTSAPPPMPEFIADHPFLFLIRHNATGAILFMGRVLDPTQ